jgi:hypothetical protein
MRFWAIGFLSLVLLGGPRDASAAFIFISPASASQPIGDTTPVTYEVFLHAGGHTGGIGLVDVTLTFSDPQSVLSLIVPSPAGNPFLAGGASLVSATDVLFTGSDITSLYPTPTGTEIIKMGEFHLVQSITLGALNITLNSGLTAVYDTLTFDTTLPIMNSLNATLGTYNVTQVIPEPGTVGLLGFGLIGLAALRRRTAQRTSSLPPQ